jgi:hypothetical protein
MGVVDALGSSLIVSGELVSYTIHSLPMGLLNPAPDYFVNEGRHYNERICFLTEPAHIYFKSAEE